MSNEHTTHQGAVGAETMTAGQALERLHDFASTHPRAHNEQAKEIDTAYAQIKSALSTPAPRTDGGMSAGEEHFGYLFHNPDTGLEWSESHPIESGEVEDAENVRPATAKALHELLIEAWSELEDARADLYSPAQPAGAVPDGLREAIKLLDEAEKRKADLKTPEGILTALAINARDKAEDLALGYVRALLASHPAGQSAGSGADALTLTGDPGNRLAPWLLSGTDEEVIEALMRRSVGDVACLFFPTPVNVADPIRRTYYEGRAPRQQRLLAELLRRLKPAPDSTRMGDEGTDLVEAVARAIFEADEDLNDRRVYDLRIAGEHVAADCLAGPRARWDDPKNAPILDAFRYRAKKAIEAVRSTGSAETVAVPLDPTDGMQQDGLAALEAAIRTHGKPSLPGFAAAHVYRAMIAAGPAAPEAQGAWSFDMAPSMWEGQPFLIAFDRGKYGDISRAPAVVFWDERSQIFRHWHHPQAPVQGKPVAYAPLPAPPASSGQGGR